MKLPLRWVILCSSLPNDSMASSRAENSRLGLFLSGSECRPDKTSRSTPLVAFPAESGDRLVSESFSSTRRKSSEAMTLKHVKYVRLDPPEIHLGEGKSSFLPTLHQRRSKPSGRTSHDPGPLPCRRLQPTSETAQPSSPVPSDTYSYLLQQEFRGLRKKLRRDREAMKKLSERGDGSFESDSVRMEEAQEHRVIVDRLLRNAYHSLAPPPRIVSGMEELRLRSSRGTDNTLR